MTGSVISGPHFPYCLPDTVDWVMMQSCFSFLVRPVLEKWEKCGGHGQFFAVVQLVGTCRQAEGFTHTSWSSMGTSAA